MPKMVMNPGHEYIVYGKMVRAGEEFEVPDAEVNLWEMFKRAARVSEEEEAKPKKRYNRRDMRAEDE